MMYIYWRRCFSTGVCAKLECLSRLTITLTLMLILTLTWSGSITTQGGSELLRRLWSEPCGRGWQVARGGGQDQGEGDGGGGSDCDCEGECKGRVL